MRVIKAINEWRDIQKHYQGKFVGFVPTMGHLHAGHVQLCQRARAENEISVVSIFINPTQFNEQQDFAKYPRTIEEDMALLKEQKIDYLFSPDQAALYPDQYEVKVMENNLSEMLEGAYRPKHFEGMLTIVLKLLNLVQPTRAYFGEKDYQQLLLVKKMVDALFVPTEIISCETVRNDKGLALSSRNSRFDDDHLLKASMFYQILSSQLSCHAIIEKLQSLDFKVDYIQEEWGRRLGAVWLNDVRLIDNVPIPAVAL